MASHFEILHYIIKHAILFMTSILVNRLKMKMFSQFYSIQNGLPHRLSINRPTKRGKER
jgi:hypothetical protein